MANPDTIRLTRGHDNGIDDKEGCDSEEGGSAARDAPPAAEHSAGLLPPLPLSTIDLLEVGADPELSWPPAEKKPSAVLAKATSKLGKKSTKLKSTAPQKLVRLKPRRDSLPGPQHSSFTGA
jgi:hypothetical protein